MDLILIHSILLIGYIFWWKRTYSATKYHDSSIDIPHSSHTNSSSNLQGISIVVPFRNEEQRIAPLLHSLENISGEIPWEILLVDDFSSDNSCGIISAWMEKNPSIPAALIRANNPGKKQALLLGIQHSTHDWILTSDADCQLPPNILASHAKIARQNPDIKCLLGRVEFSENSPKHPVLNLYETLENQVLIAISRAAVQTNASLENNAGAPIAANGANLCFHKETWMQLGNIQSHAGIASGDDIFTAQLFFDNNPKYLISNNQPDAVVIAQLCDTIPQLIHQRIRWFKKSFLQKSQKTLFQQAFFGTYLLALWVLTLLPVYRDYALFSIVPITTKALVDLWFGNKLLRYHQYNFKKIDIIWASILQTLALPILGLVSPMLKYRWKSRKIAA